MVGSIMRWLVIGAAVCAYLIAGGEVLSRFKAGLSLHDLVLKPVAQAKPPAAPGAPVLSAAGLLELSQFTFRPGLQPEWFLEEPAKLVRTNSAFLTQRIKDNPGVAEALYIWNEQSLRKPEYPSQNEAFRTLKGDKFQVFRSYDGTRLPAYRFFPSSDTAMGQTNAFGWLASDVEFLKPAKTIRIGAIGDSTSHNLYGRYLETFLNAWAKARDLGYRFEVLNAGRQGQGIEHGEYILKYELAPMGLDYAIANFAPRSPYFVKDLITLEGAAPAAAPAVSATPPAATGPLSARFSASALAAALDRAMSGKGNDRVIEEPEKPRYTFKDPALVSLPAYTMEQADAITFNKLQISNLDKLRAVAAEHDFSLVATTNFACIKDDMTLARTNKGISLYGSANGPMAWPAPYSAIRLSQEIENKAAIAWAKDRKVRMIDYARLMPVIPRYCWDLFHGDERVVRYRGWVLFQGLMPMIEQDIRDGTLERRRRQTDAAHPYLTLPDLFIDKAELYPAAGQ